MVYKHRTHTTREEEEEGCCFYVRKGEAALKRVKRFFPPRRHITLLKVTLVT